MSRYTFREPKPQRHLPVNAWRLRRKADVGPRNSATADVYLEGGPLHGARLRWSRGVIEALRMRMPDGGVGLYKAPDVTVAGARFYIVA